MNSYNTGPISELFLYDDKNNLICERWVKHETGDTVDIINNTYTYNKSSYTLQKQHRRFNDNRLIKSDTYTYDYNGNMIRKRSRLQCSYYLYHSDGKLASYELRKDDIQSYIIHYFYTYNEAGLLISQEAKNNNGLWLWEYDNNNKLISEKVYEKSDLKKEKIYSYTSFGLLNQEQTLKYSDGLIERKTIIQYHYTYFK
jgi:hypothetical protein